jgi:SAM-dependent methyltransferase
MTTKELTIREELCRLYSDRTFIGRTFTDTSEHGYISCHMIERSIALLAPELNGDFLDVGCGTQPYLPYFTHIQNKKACDFDANRGHVDFTCPADKVPLPDGCMDSILCTEVLEHVPDPLAVWNEFYRLLRPGGKVLLTTPMYWPAHELPYDFYRYPEHGIRRLVKESGFEMLSLVPRGGPWALWGQVTIHVLVRFFPFKWQRALWSRFILAVDSRSAAPRMTLGWTVLARKTAMPIPS